MIQGANFLQKCVQSKLCHDSIETEEVHILIPGKKRLTYTIFLTCLNYLLLHLNGESGMRRLKFACGNPSLTRQKSLQNNWLPKFNNKKLCRQYDNSLPLRVPPSKIILSPRLGASIQNYSKSQKFLSQRFTSYYFPQNSLPLLGASIQNYFMSQICFDKVVLALFFHSIA